MGNKQLVRGFEVVIGIETHAQLSTRSKIFSGSSTTFGAAPNTQASAVDLALPGSLPVMNRGAVERAICFGLAVGAKVAPLSIFARKNYFYPDLPKGYQISQYETPVVQGGAVEFHVGTVLHKVQLTRAHLEEDAGKSLHEDYAGQTGIDLNRAGTPLLEIVTEPDMRCSLEAVEYAKALHAMVVWLGVCDGNMQEGSFRCDANVSVRRPGAPFGTRREIKNLNSFEFMQQAINYEVQWQIAEIEDGRKIQQATVLFNSDTGETRAMRSKEDAMDYRYFPDPDLPPLVVSDLMRAEIEAAMPELQHVKYVRFTTKYGHSDLLAKTFTCLPAISDYFEDAVRDGADHKLVTNWMLVDLFPKLNRERKGIADSPVSAALLASLIVRITDGTISNNLARTVFDDLWNAPQNDDGTRLLQDVDEIVKTKGLTQISDSGVIEKIVDDVLAKSAAQIADYKAGKEKALMSIVGMVMKASAGKANPAQANAIVKRKIDAL